MGTLYSVSTYLVLLVALVTATPILQAQSTSIKPLWFTPIAPSASLIQNATNSVLVVNSRTSYTYWDIANNDSKTRFYSENPELATIAQVGRLSPSGVFFASLKRDGKIGLFDTKTGIQRGLLPLDSGAVDKFQFSLSGDSLVCVDWQKKVRIFNKNAELVDSFIVPTDISIHKYKYSDKSNCFIAMDDNTVVMYFHKTNVVKKYSYLDLSLIFQLELFGSNELFVEFDYTNLKTKIRSVKDTSFLIELNIDPSWMYNPQISKSESTLAYQSLDQQSTIVFVDLKTGKQIKSAAQNDYSDTICFDKSESQLYHFKKDNSNLSITTFDVNTGKSVDSILISGIDFYRIDRVNDKVLYRRNGRNSIEVVDLQTKRALSLFEASASQVLDIRTKDSKIWVCSIESEVVKEYDLDGTFKQSINPHNSQLVGNSFVSSDHLIQLHSDSTLSLFDLKKSILTKSIGMNDIPTSSYLDYVLDNQHKILALRKQREISVWNVETESKLYTLQNLGYASDVTFSLDSRFIAYINFTSTDTGKVVILESLTGKHFRTLLFGNNGFYGYRIRFVDDSHIVIGANGGDIFEVWNFQTGKKARSLARFYHDAPQRFFFDKEKQLLFYATANFNSNPNYVTVALNTKNFEIVQEFPNTLMFEQKALEFMYNKYIILSSTIDDGSGDHVAGIYEMQTGNLLYTLDKSNETITTHFDSTTGRLYCGNQEQVIAYDVSFLKPAVSVQSSEWSSNSLSIVPSPATNTIRLTGNFDATQREVSFEIFNTLGSLVQEGVYSNSPIDISTLPHGVYTVVVKRGGQATQSQRFVKTP